MKFEDYKILDPETGYFITFQEFEEKFLVGDWWRDILSFCGYSIPKTFTFRNFEGKEENFTIEELWYLLKPDYKNQMIYLNGIDIPFAYSISVE